MTPDISSKSNPKTKQSVFVERGLRKAGSGGARVGAGRRPVVVNELNRLVIGARCGELFTQDRANRATEFRLADEDDWAADEGLDLIHALPVGPLRQRLVKLLNDNVTVDDAQENEENEEVVEALEAVYVRRENLIGIDGTGERYDGTRAPGRIWPGEIATPKSERAALSAHIFQTVSEEFQSQHPGLTPRLVQNSWRMFQKFNRERRERG